MMARAIAVAVALAAGLLPLASVAGPSAAQRAAAERGDPRAQFALALHYDTGTPTNYPEALRWFTAAAERGYAVAQAKLGLMYLYGWSVRPDAATAFAWYRRAADRGYTPAEVQVALLYLRGHGVARDANAARRYLERAARKGDAWAAWRLGRLEGAEDIPATVAPNR